MEMKEELKKIYGYHYWRQRIQLEGSYLTPGFIDGVMWSQLELPKDMKGKTFLEVGSNDGMFCFESERRGASKVVASDLYKGSIDTMKNGWSKNGIELLKDYFKSSIQLHETGIYGLDSLKEKYDVVLVNNVIVWLEDEREAIRQLANVTSGTLYLADGFLVDDSKPMKSETKQGPMRYMYNLSYMKQVLIENGFKIDKVLAFHNQEVLTRNFIHAPQIFVKDDTKVYDLPDLSSSTRVVSAVKDQANYILNDFYHLAELGWFHKDDVKIEYHKPSILYKVSKFFGVLNIYYQYLQNKHIKRNGNTAYLIKATKVN
jgi:Methyltransferase domain